MLNNYTPLNFSHKDHEALTVRAVNHHVSLRALTFSLLVLFLVFGYNFMQMEKLSLRVWNRSFADAGMLLVGMSFALSGLCYFFNFLDKKILYRRDLGLNGFYLVAVHGLYSFLFNKFTPWFKYFEADRLPAFVPAAIALFIFLCMALISNNYAAKKLGGERWRSILRLGYIAYALGAFHVGILAYGDWQAWFGHLSLPPMSLIVTVFVGFVILLRIALWFALKNESKK